MARNIEIKTRLLEPEETKKRIAAIADAPAVVIHQDDTFFNCRSGRLKLRCEHDRVAQLIFYKRPDGEGPKLSTYWRIPIPFGRHIATLINKAPRLFNLRGRVRKTRELSFVDMTRIHMDSVKGLGSFLELEVVLENNQTIEEGTAIADDLMQQLGLENSPFIAGAYMDLIEQGEG